MYITAAPVSTAFVADPPVYSCVHDVSGYCSSDMASVRDRLYGLLRSYPGVLTVVPLRRSLHSGSLGPSVA